MLFNNEEIIKCTKSDSKSSILTFENKVLLLETFLQIEYRSCKMEFNVLILDTDIMVKYKQSKKAIVFLEKSIS